MGRLKSVSPAHPSRRHVLGTLAAAGALAVIDPGPLLSRLAAAQACADPAAAGTLIGTLPLFAPGAPVQPFGVKFGGRGLDARLVTDLSLLQPDRLITPTALAYVRTECPPAVSAHRGEWTIRASGLVARRTTLTLGELMRGARPMGAHLFECAGNNNPANFGLMSVAEWDGVPLADLIARLRPSPDATGVLVSGVDHDAQRSADSIAGASWMFPLASLERLGAFLAVRMNGAPLPPDHGAPVRLVVPQWYGCTWIKWVHAITLVGPDAPATSQMREFAGRTHQTARHELASGYTPPDIHTAATPIRVELRRGPAGIIYRIVGIVWGGTKAVDRLAIRFGADDAWKTFAICPRPATPAIWSLWEYTWQPTQAGLYRIALQVPDTSVPQRRLGSGYYVRAVQVVDVQAPART
jgi:DMSO/TMAO reductase YedYZ molybdopterin-dependent catalytic subunit